MNSTSGMIVYLVFIIAIFYFMAIRPQSKEKKKQAELDRMESETIDFHKKVVEGYRQLASLHPDRIYTVDGSLSIEEIHQQIVSQVNKKFHGKG